MNISERIRYFLLCPFLLFGPKNSHSFPPPAPNANYVRKNLNRRKGPVLPYTVCAYVGQEFMLKSPFPSAMAEDAARRFTRLTSSYDTANRTGSSLAVFINYFMR